MLEIFQNINGLLKSYPEAPYIVGALSLIFAISFILVSRELVNWFLRTNEIKSQNQRLTEELKDIRFTLNRLSEKMGLEITRIPSKSKLGFSTTISEDESSAAAFIEQVETKSGLDPIVVPTQLKSEKIENKIFARAKEVEKGFPFSH